MTDITAEAVDAFLHNRKFTRGNTRVRFQDGISSMYLHGHQIACKDMDVIDINNCGWDSNTTKERLNGIIQTARHPIDCIYQRDFQWYWKDGEIFPNNKWVTL
jgi:hypothetical protein